MLQDLDGYRRNVIRELIIKQLSVRTLEGTLIALDWFHALAPFSALKCWLPSVCKLRSTQPQCASSGAFDYTLVIRDFTTFD